MLYDFTSEDFPDRIIEGEKFQQGVSLMIECAFHPCEKSFHGDKKLLKQILDLHHHERWQLLKEHPLPYLSLSENPDTMEPFQEPPNATVEECEEQRMHHKQSVERCRADLVEREQLLELATDKHSPAWWLYYHNCEEVSMFVMFPLLRRLFPEMKLYLHRYLKHSYVTNFPEMVTEIPTKWTRDPTQRLVFDLTAWFLREKAAPLYQSEMQSIQLYTQHWELQYSWEGSEDFEKRQRTWFFSNL